jgi:hypothetical protein
MFILAKLVFKSYMPKQLEIGMWFKRDHSDVVYGKVYNYFTIYELKEIPHDMYHYMSISGAPVEAYIVQPMVNADDVEEILAFPNQIGWWDDGDESDDLEDLSIVTINKSIYGEDGEDGAVALYVDDYTRQPILVQGQIVIRDSYSITEGYDENDSEEEEDWDDMDDNDDDEYNINSHE